MSVRSHDEIRELLGAFAVDGVDDGEAAEVRAHLASCLECAAEVDTHHEVTAMLANSGGDAPSHLWERIKAQLGTSAPPGRSAPAEAHAELDELAPRRSARSAARLLATAAAVALIAVLVVQVVRLNDRVGQLQGSSPQQQVAHAAQVALRDPAAQHVALSATSSAPRLAQVVVLPTGVAFLVNDALPSLPADRTYQLWGQVGTRLISLGLLGAHPTAISFDVGRAGLVTAYAITSERAGGVIQSTHDPIAASQA
jgi:hypothetical protein